MIQRNDAHKLIEECMIAANVQAATYLLGTGVPAPYRDHDKPPEAKYADLLEFLKEFQLRMPPWAKMRPIDRKRHVCTPVTNAHLVCRLLLEKKNTQSTTRHIHHT